MSTRAGIVGRPPRVQTPCAESPSTPPAAAPHPTRQRRSSTRRCARRPLTVFEAMGDGGRRGIRGSGVRDLRVRQRESESKAMVGAKMTAKALMVAFSIRFHFDQGTVLSPGCAIFRDGGRQSLEEQPTMDKVVSLLNSVGIITFGAWVAAATIGRSLRPGSCSMFSGKREWRGASASSKKVKKRIEE